LQAQGIEQYYKKHGQAQLVHATPLDYDTSVLSLSIINYELLEYKYGNESSGARLCANYSLFF
jgi:hypothetical protein